VTGQTCSLLESCAHRKIYSYYIH